MQLIRCFFLRMVRRMFVATAFAYSQPPARTETFKQLTRNSDHRRTR